MTRVALPFGSPDAENGNQARDVLINLVPVAAGGGMQNALSFLHALSGREVWRDRTIIVCRAGSLTHEACIKLRFAHHVVRATSGGRFAFECWGARDLAMRYRSRVVFTLFGGRPWRLGPLKSISGFAFSNIIQSEVRFWHFLPPHRRIVQGLKDWLRLIQARRADTIILETDYLAERARTGVFRNRRVEVVRMEPSVLVANRTPRDAMTAVPIIDLLALAGAHPNKRLHLLAPVIAELNAKTGVRGSAFRLVVTLPESAPYTRTVVRAFEAAGVSGSLQNIGPVSPDELRMLLARVHAMVNVSLLESFSNNWVEAWVSHLPLITTDADWARASCGDAAIYVDPTRPQETAERILKGINEPQRARLIEAGLSQLDALSAQGNKIDRYFEIIERELAR